MLKPCVAKIGKDLLVLRVPPVNAGDCVYHAITRGEAPMFSACCAPLYRGVQSHRTLHALPALFDESISFATVTLLSDDDIRKRCPDSRLRNNSVLTITPLWRNNAAVTLALPFHSICRTSKTIPPWTVSPTLSLPWTQQLLQQVMFLEIFLSIYLQKRIRWNRHTFCAIDRKVSFCKQVWYIYV